MLLEDLHCPKPIPKKQTPWYKHQDNHHNPFQNLSLLLENHHIQEVLRYLLDKYLFPIVFENETFYHMVNTDISRCNVLTFPPAHIITPGTNEGYCS